MLIFMNFAQEQDRNHCALMFKTDGRFKKNSYEFEDTE